MQMADALLRYDAIYVYVRYASGLPPRTSPPARGGPPHASPPRVQEAREEKDSEERSFMGYSMQSEHPAERAAEGL